MSHNSLIILIAYLYGNNYECTDSLTGVELHGNNYECTDSWTGVELHGNNYESTDSLTGVELYGNNYERTATAGPVSSCMATITSVQLQMNR